MNDIKTAVAEIQNSFEDEEYPAGFLDKYDQMELLAGSHGTETFLVQLKSSNKLYVAKCYDRSIYPVVHESSILKSLEHACLPAFSDEFKNERVVCIVREYLAGKPLDQFKSENNLTIKDIIEICVQLCDILIYLHGIRMAMNKPDGEITMEDAAAVTSLDLSNESFNDMNSKNGGIRNIGALKYFTNLKELNLSFNDISDFSPLAGLTSLVSLGFSGVSVKDLSPLKSLTNLVCLVYDWTNPGEDYIGYADLSFMTDMKNLEIFEAKNAGIKDITVLGNIPKLWSVFLTGNSITDVSPLAKLTNLRELELQDNPITDYSPLKDIYGRLEGKDFEMK